MTTQTRYGLASSWLQRLVQEGTLRHLGGWVLVASLHALGSVQNAHAVTVNANINTSTVPTSAPSAEVRFEQALLLAEQHMDAQAMSVFEQLSREYPDRPEPRINLGVLLTRQGRLAEARDQFEQALRTSAPHALAYDNLQNLHANLARRAYASALQTGRPAPSSDEGLQLSTHWGNAAVSLATLDTAPPGAGTPTSSPSVAPMSASSPAPTPPSPALPPSTAVIASAPTLTMKTDLTAYLRPLIASLVLLALGATAWAFTRRTPAAASPPSSPASTLDRGPSTLSSVAPPSSFDANSMGTPSRLPPLSAAQPEERLINIYRMIGKGDLSNALRAAEVLAQDQPRFTLAQLVYGDLLLAETGMLRGFGRGTAQVTGGANEQISPLQHEARLRLQAWQNPPPPGSVPRQILQLPASVRQVVAVDGLRSRLFILEQRVGGLVMTSSHYASIGRLGMGKRNEGDLRTPLGIYDITGRLFTKQIGDFYGAGALSLSYPNAHDRRLQRSGANIWLHGTRLGRYADAPLSSNGCIVLANDDMGQMLNDLVPRRTPVIITDKLEWVSPKSLSAQRTWAQNLVDTWRMARMQGDLPKLMSLYAQDFDNGELRLADWRQRLSDELTNSAHRDRQLIDLSLLMWQDQEEVLFVSFREVLRGSSTGPLRQQYWARESGQWRIFSEGVVE